MDYDRPTASLESMSPLWIGASLGSSAEAGMVREMAYARSGSGSSFTPSSAMACEERCRRPDRMRRRERVAGRPAASGWLRLSSMRWSLALAPAPGTQMKDLQLLLTGPKNEQNLDECLGVPVPGVFDRHSPQLGDQFDSMNVINDGEPEIEDYIEPSMLGCFLPSRSSFGHGRRGPRRRSCSERLGLFTHNFGSHEHSTSGRTKHTGRTNNDHWTEDEVRQLVEGVSLYGVGKWSSVKKKYFQASIRTSIHLKDKWRNLVRACKKENGIMLVHLDQSLIERIKEIDAEDPYPKRSSCDEDRPAPISPNLCSVSSPSLLAQWSTMKTRTKKGFH